MSLGEIWLRFVLVAIVTDVAVVVVGRMIGSWPAGSILVTPRSRLQLAVLASSSLFAASIASVFVRFVSRE